MMQKLFFACILPWVSLLLLAGCTAMPGIETGAAFHRSKEYVVYQFHNGDTAQSLAARFLGDPSKAWIIEEANEHLRPGTHVAIPLRNNNPGGVRRHGVQQIPILCYHRFGNGCTSPLCMPVDIFERQMKYLKDNDYHVISPEELLDFMGLRRPLPRKSVMITIDDGYRSAYDVAYPILRKYGYPATLFIYTNYVEVSPKAITWKQLRELKDNGFTIGSHSIQHSDLSKQGDHESDAAYRQRLHSELAKSKQLIDKRLDQNTFLFAYPFGRINESAVNMTRQAGYQLAVTVSRGGNPFYTDPYLIRRDQVLRRDMATFKRRLKTFQSLSLR